MSQHIQSNSDSACAVLSPLSRGSSCHLSTVVISITLHGGFFLFHDYVMEALISSIYWAKPESAPKMKPSLLDVKRHDGTARKV